MARIGSAAWYEAHPNAPSRAEAEEDLRLPPPAPLSPQEALTDPWAGQQWTPPADGPSAIGGSPF